MSRQLKTPRVIAAFIQATNEHDSDKFLASFSDTSTIIDEGHDYRGIHAIKEWSDEKYIGARITLDILHVVEQRDNVVVTAAIDGNFDKTGLPDPFCMDLHFTLEGDRIRALKFQLPADNRKRGQFTAILLASLQAFPL